MEAFSLLKYWRGGGAVGTDTTATASAISRTAATNTTILTSVAQNRDESDTDSDGDDGPFFDLEFAVPDEDDLEPRDPDAVGNSTDGSDAEAQPEDDGGESDDGEEDEREFNFTVSSGSPHDHSDDPNLILSPSDDLFFKGKLVPIEPSSIEFNPSEEPNSKPQFAGALLKSATKFRVFMLGLKKSKSNLPNSNGSSEKLEKPEPPVESAEPSPNSPQRSQAPPQQKQKQQGKLFTVKFKVEEVPIVSLFTRDNSSRISATNKLQTSTQQKPISASSEESATEEKRFPKEVVQKYLKMVKPLYVRVSKRYGEKLRHSGQLSLNSSQSAPATSPAVSAENSQPGTEVAAPPSTAVSAKSSQKQGNFPAGLRVVCKHLGKSRSASSAVAAAPSTAVVSQRRDDSLLQQQDGIQSAILHCKRSFNASRDSESSLLPRSVSDSSNEKSVEVPCKSSDQGKGVSF